MRDLIVEHHAGVPCPLPPFSGHTSEAIDFQHVVTEPMAPRHTTYGTTDLVADSALYNEENLQPLTRTQHTWITRVPVPLSEAHRD